MRNLSLSAVRGEWTRKPGRPAGPAVFAVLLLVATLCWGCGLSSEKRVSADKTAAEGPSEASTPPALQPPPPEPVTIPNGTVLSARLLESISSRTAHSGQEFTGELVAPLVVQGTILVPKSSRVRGRVVTARPSGRLHEPGYLRLTLDGLQTPDGNWIGLHTTSVSAQGRNHKKRNWTLIGGGSGLGALIGGIAGGGKGAAIGAASGAGAGTAAAYATGKEDVTLAAERKLKFTTVEEVVMNR